MVRCETQFYEGGAVHFWEHGHLADRALLRERFRTMVCLILNFEFDHFIAKFAMIIYFEFEVINKILQFLCLNSAQVLVGGEHADPAAAVFLALFRAASLHVARIGRLCFQRSQLPISIWNRIWINRFVVE